MISGLWRFITAKGTSIKDVRKISALDNPLPLTADVFYGQLLRSYCVRTRTELIYFHC